MLQPVIQLGTAIHGKSFSGGALDRAQKLLHCVDILFLKKRKKRSSSVGILANPHGGGLRGGDHTELAPLAAGKRVVFADSCRRRHLAAHEAAIRGRSALA
jgi:hypothetical protein